jgi:Double-stranded RNA binding motif
MEEDAAAAAKKDDEVPMIQLASFALQKLFAEWSAEGFEIPDLMHGGQPKANDSAAAVPAAGEEVAVKAKKPPARRTELPPNAATMHPTMTMAVMRPQTAYQELGSSGTPPAMVYNLGVTVDGEEFVATARSKKLARKSAAIKACNKLFGTAYTEDFWMRLYSE